MDAGVQWGLPAASLASHRLRALLVGLAAVVTTGCARPQVAAPAPEPAPMLAADVALAAPENCRTIVRLRPTQLLADPGARDLWEAFVDPQREQGFAERTGIAPRALSEVVFFELAAPEGAFALLARGSFDAPGAVRDAGERLAFVEVSVESPWPRREGLKGEGRWAYVALGPDVMLTARDLPPAELGALLQRLLGAPSVLSPHAMALAAAERAAPLAVLVPQPLALPGGGGAAILLSRQQALSFRIEPQQDAMALALELRGEFPTTAEANFEALIRSIADSGLGRELGLERALGSLTVEHAPAEGRVSLGMQVSAADLVAGLRLLFADELTDLFR